MNFESDFSLKSSLLVVHDKVSYRRQKVLKLRKSGFSNVEISKKLRYSLSTIEKDIRIKKVKKMDKSFLIGEILAKRAKEKNISEVYFDRGGNKYHGRIKNFADSLRKNGLKF